MIALLEWLLLALAVLSPGVSIPVASDGVAPTPTATATPMATATAIAPTATPAPAVWPAVLSEAEMAAAMRQAGWPEWAIPTALGVTWCESSYNRFAIGEAGELGLFQIHPVHTARWQGRDWTHPVQNAAVALEIFNESGGFGPWSCA